MERTVTDRPIVVTKIHKYSIGASDGQTYTLTKDSGLQVNQFSVGGSYNVQVSSANGRNYIVGLAGAAPSQVSSSASKMENPPSLPHPVTQQTQTKSYDKSNKDEKILYQGVLQAVVQAPALSTFSLTADEWAATVENMTDRLVNFIKSRLQ